MLAGACLVLWAAAGVAVPPPPQRSGVDCEQPVYASDRLVCADLALLALDRQVGQSWHEIVAGGFAPDAAAWFEDQPSWFARRGRCAFSALHAACLRAAYGERALLLQAWRRSAGAALPSAAWLVRCTHAPWGSDPVHAIRDDGVLMIFGSAGRVLVVARADVERDDWQPFLRLGGAPGEVRLLPLSGEAALCTAA